MFNSVCFRVSILDFDMNVFIVRVKHHRICLECENSLSDSVCPVNPGCSADKDEDVVKMHEVDPLQGSLLTLKLLARVPFSNTVVANGVRASRYL